MVDNRARCLPRLRVGQDVDIAPSQVHDGIVQNYRLRSSLILASKGTR